MVDPIVAPPPVRTQPEAESFGLKRRDRRAGRRSPGPATIRERPTQAGAAIVVGMIRSNFAMRMKSAPSSEADTLYEDACSLWTAGRRREAIERLDAALRLDADAPHVLVMGGYMLGEMGKREAAVRFYRRALLLDPHNAVAHANVGKLLVELRRPVEALEAFDAVIALNPVDADAWNSRAGALRELGRLEDSLDCGAPCAGVEARFPGGGDQLRQRAPEA